LPPAAHEPTSQPELIICHDCDLLQRRVVLRQGECACCGRCGETLQRRPRDVVTHVLALSLSSLGLLIFANVFPFIGMTMFGRSESSFLTSGMTLFLEQGYWELSLALAVISVIAPLIVILGLLYMVVPLKLGYVPPGLPRVLSFVTKTRPWSMMEVLLLAVFVSWLKLSQDAVVHFGPGSWAFAALVVTLIATLAAFDPAAIWEHVEYRRTEDEA